MIYRQKGTLLSLRSFKKSGSYRLFSTLEKLGAKAYLSTKIIKKITNDDLDFSKKSLRQQILQDLEGEKKNVQPSCCQQMKKLFDKGADIDSFVFNQQRTKISMNKTNTFTFCPSNLVTSKVLRQILQQKINTLYTGHYGISKSVSLMLFSILSNIIVEYNFKSYGKNETKFKGQIMNTPKVIYYNLEYHDLKNWKKLSSKILKQCESEIPEDRMMQFLDYSQNILDSKQTLIRDYYEQKNIETILLVDQLSLVQNSQQNQGNVVRQGKYKKILSGQIKQKFGQIMNEQFTSIAYFSSLNIKSVRLNQLKLGSGKGHLNLVQKRISYLQLLRKQKSIFQIIDLFLFELTKMIQTSFLSTKISKNQIQFTQIEKQLFKQLPQQLEIKDYIRLSLVQYIKQISRRGYFITFLSIKQYFLYHFNNQFRKKLIQNSNVKNISQYKQIVTNVLKQILGYTYKHLQNKFQSFLDKIQQRESKVFTDQQRHSLIFTLYYSASKAYNNRQNDENLYQIQLDKMNTNLSNKVLQYCLDKRLFQFKNNKVYSYTPPSLIKDILKNFINQSQLYLYNNNFNQLFKYFNSSSLGIYAQNIFIRMCLKNQPNIFLKFFDSNDSLIYFLNIEKQQYHFEPINQKLLVKNKWFFLNSIKQILIKNWKELKEYNLQTLSAKNFSRSIFMIPRKDNKINYTSEQKSINPMLQIIQNNNFSFCIDFMIVKLSYIQKPRISINAFDMTLSDSQKNNPILIKTSKFIQAFVNFADKHTQFFDQLTDQKKVQIDLNFFVICQNQYKQNLGHYLKKYENILTFAQNDLTQKRIVSINSFKDKKPSLLKKVGYVTIGDYLSVQVGDKYKIQSEYKIWELIQDIIVKHRKFKDQQSNKLVSKFDER